MSTSQRNVFLSLVFLSLYALGIIYIGFFVATGVYLIAHMSLLGIRKPHVLVLVTIGVLLVFYTVVEMFLQVSLPHGVLY